MRILTYKRTHIGDPNHDGKFGVNDCMGRVRSLAFDAVIGVGGVGAAPRCWKIAGKITWVGIHPTQISGQWAAPIVTFQHFRLFDANGPELYTLAPSLADRIYRGKVRYMLNSYTSAEQADAERVVLWAMDKREEHTGEKIKAPKGIQTEGLSCRVRGACRR